MSFNCYSEIECEESIISNTDQTESGQVCEWQVCLVNQRMPIGMTFHISSDFFFDLGFDSRTSIQEQMLSYSHFKRILQLEHRLREGVVVVKLENISPPMKDIKVVRDILKTQPFKRLQIISNLLSDYEKTLVYYERQIALLSVQRMLNLSDFEVNMALRKEFFDRQLYQKLQELSQNGVFYQYINTSVNLNTGHFEIIETGYSEPLISLLGSDPTQFTATLMRKGPIEVIAQRNRDIFTIGRLRYEMLQVRDDCPFTKGIECQIITFDDLEVPCFQCVEHFRNEYPPELQMNGDTFRKEHVVFLKYDITVETLSRIIAIRQQNKFMQNNDWVNDFGYSIMSEILLEKYYQLKKKPNKVSSKSSMKSSIPSTELYP